MSPPGAVGLFVCQWAKALGARVIGTVSSEDKARLARANGWDAPIVSRNYRFAAAAREAADGRRVDVIYDGLGRAALEENLKVLAVCGHWVSSGQANGPPGPVEVETLSEKSLTPSRPVLFHYTAEPATRREIAERVFTALRQGGVAPVWWRVTCFRSSPPVLQSGPVSFETCAGGARRDGPLGRGASASSQGRRRAPLAAQRG